MKRQHKHEAATKKLKKRSGDKITKQQQNNEVATK